MSTDVVVVYKKCGQTPLTCIQELKKKHPEYAHMPMTYAGRLDPLASGVLIILIGDECLKKDEYLALPKEYEVTILFGYATDTYDVMGKVIAGGFSSPASGRWRGATEGWDVSTPSPQSVSMGHSPLAGGEEFSQALSQFLGRITQAYPPYSSRTIAGKPLFQWAREGKLSEITIPSHNVYIESIEIRAIDTITGDSLLQKIKRDISRVAGDFRQAEIIALWEHELIGKKDAVFQTLSLEITCSSGVYVRALAHDLGGALGVPALALDIVRTKVGEYIIP
jgi:tRNA pseudouridine55 synthase